MLTKFKNLEPQTKAILNAIAAIAAINVVAATAVMLMDNSNTEND